MAGGSNAERAFPAACRSAPRIQATARAAVAFAAGSGANTGGVSAHTAALAEEALKAMIMTKAKVGMTLLLAAGLVAGGAGVVAQQALATRQPEAKQGAATKRAPARAEQPGPKEGRQAAPPKWEYRVLHEQELSRLGKGDVAAGLNQLGAEGWELAVFEPPVQSGLVYTVAKFYFKRPK